MFTPPVVITAGCSCKMPVPSGDTIMLAPALVPALCTGILARMFPSLLLGPHHDLHIHDVELLLKRVVRKLKARSVIVQLTQLHR